jgi:hypothetical protein
MQQKGKAKMDLTSCSIGEKVLNDAPTEPFFIELFATHRLDLRSKKATPLQAL